METNINRLYHNYIIKMVIFTIFLYKRNFRQATMFQNLVISFLKKRLPWDINLSIDTSNRLPKEMERQIYIIQLLEDIEIDYLNNVIVSFKTPITNVTLNINLKEEEKYMKYIYS
jgi:hypothetical protein